MLARFKIAGAGQRPQLAQIDMARWPDPRAVLETALGPLVLFELFPAECPEDAIRQAAE